jgi:beta-galactosidase
MTGVEPGDGPARETAAPENAAPRQSGKGHPRRRFLIGLGAVAAGSAAVVPAFLGGGTPPVKVGQFGDEWLFGAYQPGCTDAEFNEHDLEPVTVPHCVTPLSWQSWQPTSWERVWVYRQHFDVPDSLRAGRAFVRLDGALSTATVFLNGRPVSEHVGGYLPLTSEVTALLKPLNNVLAIAVDGRWNQDVPPNLPRFPYPSAIDFYQPAGLYRPVHLIGTPKTYLFDVFAQQADVLTDARTVSLQCVIDAAKAVTAPGKLTATLRQGGPVLATASVDLVELPKGQTTVTVTLDELAAVRLWDLDDPAMCDIDVTLSLSGKDVHTYHVRTGLRDAQFSDNGFTLNGKQVKLFGLNRHQWYPYVGGAMPDRVQRQDAHLLKSELSCNMVRCSHYPQSTAFLDACDELGLLVWEELPGWDYVGDDAWQAQALQDVHDMVVRDRNHPSIIVWGTRVNETLGQAKLYDRTDRLAASLDPTRPCTGAVAGDRGYRSSLSPVRAGAGVFSFNDYSRPLNPNTPPTLRPPRSGVPYLVSESIGTLVGPPHFRRTDPVSVQQQQGVLHAWVHERAAANPGYCGLLAWCGFDYPSGWYHAVKGVKYPGVMDFFRIPKLGAGFYRAQRDPAAGAVIEPAFYWDFGPSSPPTGPGRGSVIWSNCDKLIVTIAGQRPVTVLPDRATFPHLDHPPFLVDLLVPAGRQPELSIEGQVNGKPVLQRKFSPDPAYDVLSVVADDTVLTADGQDTTRVALRALDRYGAPRPYVDGALSVGVDGPGTLIGDWQLDFAALGGAGAVWVRSVRDTPGSVTLYALHPTLGTASAEITTTSSPAALR